MNMTTSTVKKQNTRGSSSALTTALLSVLLFMYTFRKVSIGIEMTDTGYHFANFLYMDQMDSMWIFSTYLASKLGHLFTLLPGGDTLLGINIYTSLIPAALGVLTFLFFSKCVKTPGWLSFLGAFIALNLCWCPTTCVYNYLTYLFFGGGAMLLWLGLTKNERGYLVAAGVLLGLNVLVRFPNLAEMALILAVWAYGLMVRKKFSEVMKDTGFCVLGYAAGIVLVMLQIQIQYGIGEYIQGIIRLFRMTSDASSYTPVSMAYNILEDWLKMGWWLYIVLLALALGVLGFLILPRKFERVKKGGYLACCVLLMAFFYKRDLFTGSFDDLSSVLGPVKLLMVLTLLLALTVLILKRFSAEKKLMAVIVVIILGITPIGSNNQLTTNINFMFLPMCFVLDTLWQLFGVKDATQACEISLARGKCQLVLNSYPVKALSLVYLVLLLYLSTGFGANYVFRDDTSNGERTVQVESIESLKGMKTSAVRAAQWEALGEFADKERMEGCTAIFYGDIPTLSAYLKMPFLMSPWPDLQSYSNAVFESEIAQIEANLENERPYIFLGSGFKELVTSAMLNGMSSGEFMATYGYKFGLLYDMILENDYTCVFDNEICAVYY